MDSPDRTNSSTEQVIQLSLNALQNLPLGMLKVSADGLITYANSAMRKMLGATDEIEDVSLNSFLDDKNLEIVQKNLLKRSKDKVANFYMVELTLKNGRKLPVQILAVPEINPQGEFISSLVIARNQLEHVVSRCIHESIASYDGTDILKDMAKTVQYFLPFDLLTVALYSEDHKSMRSYYNYPPEEGNWQIRWWDIPEIAEQMVNDVKSSVVGDIAAILDLPGWEAIRDSEVTKDFMSRGFRSSLRLPLIDDKRPVASINFYSKTLNAFSQEDIEFVESVPIRHAISKTLRFEAKRDAAFKFELLKEIAILSGDNIKEIAQIICHGIRGHYKWDNVAFFEPVVNEGKFKLLAQSEANSRCKAPDDYQQPITEGVLSYVYNERQPVNIADLKTRLELKDKYLPLFEEEVRSELCMPVVVNDRVVLILNVEDSHVNAVSDQEEEFLGMILSDVASSIERTRLEKSNRRFEVLHDIHYEIAMQTKTPLSIAYSVLNRLESKVSDDAWESINTALRQLTKIDLTFDRLVLLEQNLDRQGGVFPYNESKLNLLTVIDEIINALPRSVHEFILFEKDASLDKRVPRVKCDLYQINFCIESLLSYFLRMASERDRIKVCLSIDNGNVLTRISGLAPAISSDGDRGYRKARDDAKLKMDIAIGADIIRKFIENAEGKLHEPKIAGKDIEIKFSIPVS